jgi:acetoacetyl-CoA synthetase
MAARHPEIVPVRNEGRHGFGMAIRYGLSHASGDAVAIVMGNRPEAVASIFGAAMAGAVAIPMSTFATADDLAAMLRRSDAVAVLTQERLLARRFGDELTALQSDLPSLRLVATLGTPSWDAFLTTADTVADDALDEQSAAVTPDDGGVVIFTSGTTSEPKGIVHGHGGVLLEHLKVLSLHSNLGPGDVFFWHTALSWMMWNYQAGGLLVGSTIVCFSGHPLYPGADRLWQLLEDEKVTYFGTSPAQLQASRKAGLTPGTEHRLDLRTVGSTGSALAPDLFTWITERVQRFEEISVSSVCGGTDVVTAFAGGSQGVPVVPGELSVRYLGCALQAWAPDRTPLVGEVGEMVITAPMPSMPVCFWDDPDGGKYRAAYFEHEWSDGRSPHTWRHGDWVEVTERGSLLIRGRSDATLNRNGIRMGCADIYEVVEAIDDIAEAMVVGIDGPDGKYWMPLYVTLVPGADFTDELVDRIRSDVRKRLSPRHVPDEVVHAPAIPHTRTGKKLEIPVTQILRRQDVDVDPKSVDDPAVLDWYRLQACGHAW